MRSAASWTVEIFSAPSSSSWRSNFSSRAIMISTVSRESAPRSTNLDSAVTESRSVPSCSAMISRTSERTWALSWCDVMVSTAEGGHSETSGARRDEGESEVSATPK